MPVPGLPLHMGKLRKKKLSARLPKWKGRLLSKPGRLALVNSVLSSLPTYHLTIFPLSKWAKKKLDRIRRSFLKKGNETVNYGHCLVNWVKVYRPKRLGGLGISDLREIQSRTQIKMDVA